MEPELFMAWPRLCSGLYIPYLLHPGIVFQFDTIKSVGGFSPLRCELSPSMWAGLGPLDHIDLGLTATLQHWLFMAAILITIMATIQLGSGVQSKVRIVWCIKKIQWLISNKCVMQISANYFALLWSISFCEPSDVCETIRHPEALSGRNNFMVWTWAQGPGEVRVSLASPRPLV